MQLLLIYGIQRAIWEAWGWMQYTHNGEDPCTRGGGNQNMHEQELFYCTFN